MRCMLPQGMHGCAVGSVDAGKCERAGLGPLGSSAGFAGSMKRRAVCCVRAPARW